MMRRVGLACLMAPLVLILVQPLLAPHDPMRTDVEHSLQAPGGSHPLGTDGIGRDVLARLAAGARTSLGVALVALLASSLAGAVVGSVSGLSGGLVDRTLTCLVDLLLAFPRFVILLNLAAVIPLGSPASLGLVIGATSWMGVARLARTEVLSLRERPFVAAARVAGAGGARVLVRHIAPHLVRLVLESAGLRFASVILLAASLDYLGVGLPADSPTWGRMIRDGQGYIREAPWIVLPVVGVLCLTAVGLVLAGERRSTGSLLGR